MSFDLPASIGPPGPAGSSSAPISPAQVPMVWHEQFAPGSFNISPLVRRYRGQLHVAALEAALGEIVARHASLRATFTTAAGRGVQRFAPPARPGHFRLPVVDLGDRPYEASLAEVRRLVVDARRRPMDLVAGPVFAPTLIRLGDDDHVLMIRVHHAVFDDWSVGPYRRELSALYTAFAADAPSPLPPLPVGFDQVCRHRQRALDDGGAAREHAFWAEELAGAALSTQLPIGDPARPPGAPQPATAPLTVDIDPDVASALRALARRERSTVFMVMNAAFAVLVSRYTGQEDLVLSTLVANRDRPEVEGLIGCFSKKVPVRLRLDGDPTFTQFIDRTKHALLRAMAHSQLGYEAVLQAHLGPAAAAHGLAAQVGVKFQAAITVADRVHLPGLTPVPVPPAPGPLPHFLARPPDTEPAETAEAPWGGGLYLGTFLGLSVTDTPDRLAVVTEGAFHPPAVERLLARYAALLTAIAATPASPLSQLGATDLPARAALAGMVDLRGFAVEPARIEAALADAPGVQKVAVIVRRDDPGRPQLVAYLEAKAGRAAPTLAQLRHHLWTKIPGYAWPAAVVTVDSLPAGPAVTENLPAPTGAGGGGDPNAEETRLRAWWAAAGGGPVGAEANYWQSFSFLDALAAAARAGHRIDPKKVTRNRTLETLALDITTAAARR